MNRIKLSETKISFQDFIQSSQKLEIGSHVELNNGGRWTVARFKVIEKYLSSCGTMHNFIAEIV